MLSVPTSPIVPPMSKETTNGGGRKPLAPGEVGKYEHTGHRKDGTVTTGTASYYQARAWIGLPHSGRKRVQVRVDAAELKVSGKSASKAIRDALDARAKELVQVDREDHLAKGGDSIPPTWEAAVLNHREYIGSPLANKGRGYSAASVRVYRSAMDAYMIGERAPFKADRRLSSITNGDLEEWLIGIANSTEMKGKRRLGGEGAAKTVRSLVQGMYKRALKRDVVAKNPTMGLEFNRSPELKRGDASERNRGRAFTREQVDHLLEVAYSDPRCVRNDMGDLVRFLLATGCRVGEARALTWEHVHLDGRRAVTTGVLRSGHGRPAGEDLTAGFVTIAHTEDSSANTERERLARTKTERAYRDVALASPVVDALRERRERMGRADHERPLILGEVGAVFPNGEGKLRDQSGLNEQFRHLFEVAGVPWATTHTFRKTTVNLLSDAGYPLQRIAAHIGDSVETVTRHYLDDRTADVDAGATVDQAVFGTAPAEKMDTEVDTEPRKSALQLVKAG